MVAVAGIDPADFSVGEGEMNIHPDEIPVYVAVVIAVVMLVWSGIRRLRGQTGPWLRLNKKRRAG